MVEANLFILTNIKGHKMISFVQILLMKFLHSKKEMFPKYSKLNITCMILYPNQEVMINDQRLIKLSEDAMLRSFTNEVCYIRPFVMKC